MKALALCVVALAVLACGPAETPGTVESEVTAPLRGEPGEPCPALFAGGCSDAGDSLACGAESYAPDAGLVWQEWGGNPLHCGGPR